MDGDGQGGLSRALTQAQEHLRFDCRSDITDAKRERPWCANRRTDANDLREELGGGGCGGSGPGSCIAVHSAEGTGQDAP